jgi:predicted NBD/HSP70 family sugar kinase
LEEAMQMIVIGVDVHKQSLTAVAVDEAGRMLDERTAVPPPIKRICLIAVVSFFFAQCTTIFINIPFTWVMRFFFCATLLAALSYLRVNGSE